MLQNNVNDAQRRKVHQIKIQHFNQQFAFFFIKLKVSFSQPQSVVMIKIFRKAIDDERRREIKTRKASIKKLSNTLLYLKPSKATMFCYFFFFSFALTIFFIQIIDVSHTCCSKVSPSKQKCHAKYEENNNEKRKIRRREEKKNEITSNISERNIAQPLNK